MAPMPTEVKLTTHVDVGCARCGHPSATLTLTLPLLGTTLDQGHTPLPVADVRVGETDVEMKCDSCHQVVRWRGAPLEHDFPADAYPPVTFGAAFGGHRGP